MTGNKRKPQNERRNRGSQRQFLQISVFISVYLWFSSSPAAFSISPRRTEHYSVKSLFIPRGPFPHAPPSPLFSASANGGKEGKTGRDADRHLTAILHTGAAPAELAPETVARAS